MNLYNNKVSKRINDAIRKYIIIPCRKRHCKQNDTPPDFTLLSNTCQAGIVLHDYGMRFDTPTINVYFWDADVFAFFEDVDYYLSQELVNSPYDHRLNWIEPKDKVYPKLILPGDKEHKDVEIHFIHDTSAEEVKKNWSRRLQRVHWDKINLLMILRADDLAGYEQFERLPYKKAAFVSRPVDQEQYPDIYYIKGLEQSRYLHKWNTYKNIFGQKYYDTFDFLKWLNNDE